MIELICLGAIAAVCGVGAICLSIGGSKLNQEREMEYQRRLNERMDEIMEGWE